MACYFSILVSEAMELIGYSERIIEVRAHICKEIFEVASQHCMMEAILAGSKSEGVVPIKGGDIDIIHVLPFRICVDHGQLEDKMIIIETDMNKCPPGYTKLRPTNPRHRSGIPLMPTLDDLDYISSFAAIPEIIPYINAYKQINKTIAGPAALSSIWHSNVFLGVIHNGVSIDHVFAIRYYSATILREWAKRKRQFDWPPPDVIEDVSTTEGYIVPFGHKLRTDQDFEWRICFTTGECKLVGSFNETQLKLYIVLKMVVKDILKPAVDSVSSYMVKNVVFWVMEHTQTFVFTRSNLMKCVLHALWFLLHCLHSNNLPNYMIPKRNLLIGRVQGNQIAELRHLTRELLNEGETIVLKCEMIKNAMYVAVRNHSLATRIRSWRDEIEQLCLLFNCNYGTMMLLHRFGADAMFCDVLRDESCLRIVLRLADLLFFDVISGTSDIRKMLDFWLSRCYGAWTVTCTFQYRP